MTQDTQEFADLTSHYIDGIAREGNTPFRVTLLSHITGNLWTGGCPQHGAPKEFEFIVNLYPWETYPLHPHQVVTIARLYDHGTVPDPRILNTLASYVNECMKVGLTLVHCQAGLNRSALVATLALVHGGMEPGAAIKLMREKRCDAVLCNKTFEQWLLSYRRDDRRQKNAR